MYIHSHAGGDVILTNDTLTIPEGNSDNLCVQLIAGPTMLDEALVVELSVSLDGNTGIIYTCLCKQSAIPTLTKESYEIYICSTKIFSGYNIIQFSHHLVDFVAMDHYEISMLTCPIRQHI